MSNYSSLRFIYYLNNNNVLSNTNDLNYAMNWLLTNILSNNNTCYILIKSYTNSETECITEGIIKYDGCYIIRYHPNTPQIETRYSPYDTSLFYRADLSHMYLQILNNNSLININQELKNNNFDKVNPPNYINIPKISTPTNNNQISEPSPRGFVHALASEPIKKPSIKEEINTVLLQSKKLTNNNLEDSESDNESVATEDIKNIENELDNMLKMQESTKQEIKNTEEELTDAASNYNYERNKERKKKEKEKELRNIFSADLNVYKKIKDNHKEKCNESTNNINIIDLVPKLFEAKFYVIKYLDDNEYLEFENIDSPTDEIYELYNMLYDVQFNNKQDILENYEEEMYEVINDFLDYMSNKNVLTYEEINDYLNKKSDMVSLLTVKDIVD